MMNLLALILTGLFWLLFLGRTAMLMRRGVQVFVLGKGKGWKQKLVEWALTPLMVLWSVEILMTALGNPLFPLALMGSVPELRGVGLGFCVAGLMLFVWALVSFGGAWRVGIDERHSDRLITGGAFGFSRNPIFLFMDMYMLGIFLICPTLFFLLVFVGGAVLIHMQILNEERFLQGKFGGEYVDYRRRVRRYL